MSRSDDIHEQEHFKRWSGTMEIEKTMPKENRSIAALGMIAWIAPVCLALAILTGCGAAATYPAAPVTAAPAPATSAPAAQADTPVATPAQPVDISSQLKQIDALLQHQITGSIAYNKPGSMSLGQTATIELLLNPSVSEQELATQVTESGSVATASIELTPQMKAVLLSPLAEAFTIQPVQAETQLISGSQTTKWSWFVTANKSGTQKLVLVIYRLVKFQGEDYWREVETYKTDIEVKVPFARWILSIDWKWLISILVAMASLPFVWRWFNRRNKAN